MLLCHTKYEVPLQYKFLIERFDFEVVAAVPVAPSVQLPLVFDLSVHATRDRDGVMAWIDVNGTLREGGRVLARSNAVARAITPAGYRKLRNGRDTQNPHLRSKPAGTIVVTAGRVGRTEEQDVLLATHDSGVELYCAPDPRNRALFDHPVDHVPGMVIFEAARQALRYRINQPAAQIAKLSTIFPTFTEWEAPCTVAIAALVSDGLADRYCARFTQSNVVSAELEFSLGTPR